MARVGYCSPGTIELAETEYAVPRLIKASADPVAAAYLFVIVFDAFL